MVGMSGFEILVCGFGRWLGSRALAMDVVGTIWFQLRALDSCISKL